MSRSKTPSQALRLASLAVALSPSVGCKGFMYSQTGAVTTGFAVDHMTPWMMSRDDVDLACQTGSGLGEFTASFERVTDRPDKAVLSAWVPAASCAEAAAWEAELRGMRALREGQVSEAQDARLDEKRMHERAARRYYTAWTRLVAAYGEPGTACPEFEDRNDEALYLLGLISGALGIVHDRAADARIGVPSDVPRKVAAGTACLNDATWFGVPLALRASIWTSIPGFTPEGVDPFAELQKAAAMGEAVGVRLARAIQIESLNAAGRLDDVKSTLTLAAKSITETPSHGAFRLLDLNGQAVIQQMSDRLWTREAGHRTPFDALGTFPGAAAPPVEDEELFEGLSEPAAPPGTQPLIAQPPIAQPPIAQPPTGAGETKK